jgi:hypothetical protein
MDNSSGRNISFLAYMNYGSVRVVTGDVAQGIVKGMERISNYTLTRRCNWIKSTKILGNLAA